MNHKGLPIIKDLTGLSRGYRFRWRLQYFGFFIYGPADQMPHLDPKERLKRARALKVYEAHGDAGTIVPEEVLAVLNA